MHPFSSIGRTVAATGAVGGLMVVLAACGSEAEMVSANQVEEDINQLVQRENGRPADLVECPDLPAEVGGSIRCSVMTADRKEHGVTVTVTSIEGSMTNYVIKVD
jgi:hypothetical protein